MNLSRLFIIIVIALFILVACTAPVITSPVGGMSPQEMQRYLDNLTNTAVAETKTFEQTRFAVTQSDMLTKGASKRDSEIMLTSAAARLTSDAAILAPTQTRAAATTTASFHTQTANQTATQGVVNNNVNKNKMANDDNARLLTTFVLVMIGLVVLAITGVVIYLIVQSRNFIKSIVDIIIKWLDLQSKQVQIVRMNEEFYLWWNENERRYNLMRYNSLPAPQENIVEGKSRELPNREEIIRAHIANIDRLILIASMPANRNLYDAKGKKIPYDTETGLIGWSFAALKGRDVIKREWWDKYTDALDQAGVIVKVERETTRWAKDWNGSKFLEKGREGRLAYILEGETAEVAEDVVVIHCPALLPPVVQMYSEARAQTHRKTQETQPAQATQV